jgi:hypothetical protein
MTFRIDSDGGRIGRFWWDNSGQGGLFLPYGQFFTSFRPGRCGWRESWPDETAAWPVAPWGKGDPADDYCRDFAAFEPWFDRQMDNRNLDDFDPTLIEKIELYDLLVGVFNAGIEAGQNPWRWAKDVEAKLLRQAIKPVDREVGP